MISYPASLKAVGGAKTGVAPVNLLEIQTLDNGLFLWSDRKVAAPSSILASAQSSVPAQPPVLPIPAGQFVAWSFPTNITIGQPIYGSVVADLKSADLIFQGIFNSLDDPQASATWDGFTVPVLPAGAVIQGVYPVLLVAGSGSGAFNGGPVLNPMPGSGDFEGQYSDSSLGSTPAAITGASMTVKIYKSAPPYGDVLYQELVVSFVGLAVYYSLPSGGSSGGGSSLDETSNGNLQYDTWLLSVPSFAFHRSLQTDIGSFVVQNLSGDTLSRDVEKLLRASAMEGAFFVYRLWQPDAQAAWLEVHGTLTVGDVGVDTMTLKATQLLNPSQDDTPLESYCETCQLQWAALRCGSTQSTECNYSFQTCQVVERIMVALNDYEKNYGETTANTALNVINRRRRI